MINGCNLFTIFIEILCIALSSSNKCDVGSWITNKRGDLKLLQNVQERLNAISSSSHDIFQSSDGYKFTFCHGLEKASKPVFDTKEVILIAQNQTKLYVITLMGGLCSSSKCNKTNYQAQVYIACDPLAEQGQFFLTYNDTCLYTFALATKEMCAEYKSTPSVSDTDSNPTAGKSQFSGIGVFFILLFVGAGAYFVAGFLYKRYVLGAQGYEQIPNYLFWRRIVRCVQATVGGNNYLRSSANDPSYRNYDDGNDEFRYDQPPLMAGSVQEPSPNDAQRRFSGRSPNNASKDESDVRLLVV